MADRDKAGVDTALIERWARAYLERFPSSAANLRRVLLRRIERHNLQDRDAAAAAMPVVDALIAGYRETGLVDDTAYAAARARVRLRRGQSLRTIRAGLAAKGVDAAAAATALAGLGDDGDPDITAAIAFARRRGFGPFRRDAAAAGAARELAAFARAGFSRAVAEMVLACADADAANALLQQ